MEKVLAIRVGFSALDTIVAPQKKHTTLFLSLKMTMGTAYGLYQNTKGPATAEDLYSKTLAKAEAHKIFD